MFAVTACVPDLIIDEFQIDPPRSTTVDLIKGTVIVKNLGFRAEEPSRVAIKIKRRSIIAPAVFKTLYSHPFYVPSLGL